MQSQPDSLTPSLLCAVRKRILMAGHMLKLLFCFWAALMLGAPSPAMGARSLRQVATGMHYCLILVC